MLIYEYMLCNYSHYLVIFHVLYIYVYMYVLKNKYIYFSAWSSKSTYYSGAEGNKKKGESSQSCPIQG